MRLYLAFVVATLSFTTAASLACFMLGMQGADVILATKDLMLLCCVVVAVVYRLAYLAKPGISVRELDMCVGVLVAVNLLSFLTSPAASAEKIVNLRRNASLFIFLWSFYFVGRFRACLPVLTRLSYGSFAILGVFGIAEYFSPLSFWNGFVRIPAYWRAIAFDPFGATNITESGRFFSWDLMALHNEPLRRMVSLYAEPTTLAAFFVFIFCISYLRFGPLFRMLVFLIGLLTVSKFFVLSVLLVVSLRRYKDRIPKHFLLYCYAGCTLAGIMAVASDVQAGALAHLNGIFDLFSLIQQKKFFGFGLGAAGNYSTEGSSAGDLGAESGIGNVAAQLGLGFVAYLWVLNRVFQRLHKSWKASGNPHYLVSLLLLSSWVVSFFMSASSLGLSGNAFFFIYIGAVLALEFVPSENASLSDTSITLSAKERRTLQELSPVAALM